MYNNQLVNSKQSGKAPFIGIRRHRLWSDGQGVTTLVAFWGCPLRCRYCLNEQCHEEAGRMLLLSPRQLYEKVKLDNLYFRATQGGITFGGGEPAMYANFIREFRELCGKAWHINMETSLNVRPGKFQMLLPVIIAILNNR